MILGIGFDDPFLVGLIGLGAMLFMVTLGVRVVFAAAVVGLLGLVELNGWDAGAGIAGTVPHSKSSSYALSVLPMFILIGFLAFHAGMTQQLFDCARTKNGVMAEEIPTATVITSSNLSENEIMRNHTSSNLSEKKD